MILYNFKNFLRFVSGYMQVYMGCDKSSALDKYIEISKKHDISEQIDGYISKYEEMKDILDSMLIFCKDNVDEVCHDNAHSKVLDYGCGTGRYLKLLENYDIYGVDANNYTLENHTIKKVPRAKLYSFDFSDETDTEAIEFIYKHHSSFDVVYSIIVIQLLQMSKIDLWFDNMLKLLKPKGRFILNFPVPAKLMDRYHVGYTRYTPKEIIDILERKGCKIISAKSNIYNQTFDKYQIQSIDYGYNIVAEKV